MRLIITLIGTAALHGGLAHGDIVETQDFDSLSHTGTMTFDSLEPFELLTNSGAKNHDGPGSLFSTSWYDTRGVGHGPVVPGVEGVDFIGVNADPGDFRPDVGPDGTPVLPGFNHNYIFNDTDGRVTLGVHAPIGYSTLVERSFSFHFWIAPTDYETGDEMFVEVVVDHGDGFFSFETLLMLEPSAMMSAASADDGTPNWHFFSASLEPMAAMGEIVAVNFTVDSDVIDENIFVDDITWHGAATQACCFDGGGCMEFTESDCLDFGGTPLGAGTTCSVGPADVDGDGTVGFSDLIAVLGSWGICPGCPTDLDDDGIVGFSDLIIVLSSWGGACS